MQMGLHITLDNTRRFNVRYVTEERKFEVRLNVFLTLDRVIQEVHEERQAEPST